MNYPTPREYCESGAGPGRADPERCVSAAKPEGPLSRAGFLDLDEILEPAQVGSQPCTDVESGPRHFRESFRRPFDADRNPAVGRIQRSKNDDTPVEPPVEAAPGYLMISVRGGGGAARLPPHLTDPGAVTGADLPGLRPDMKSGKDSNSAHRS